MPTFKTVRGMRDFLPEEAKMMKYIEGKARKIAELYGYKEIILAWFLRNFQVI